MTVYFTVLMIIVLGGVLTRVDIKAGRNTVSGKKLYLFVSCCLIAAVMAIRGLTVGTDTGAYSRIFTRIASANTITSALQDSSGVPAVYVLICWFAGRISTNPQMYIITMALTISASLYVFLRKASQNYSISLFLYFGLTLFYYSLNGSRQTLSMLIAINGILYLIENTKSIKGWALFILGVAIHSTSIIMIVSVMGTFIARKVKDKRILFIGSAMAGAVTSTLITRLGTIMARYFGHYSMYIAGGNGVQLSNQSAGGRIVVVYLFLLAFIIIDILQSGIENNDKNYYTRLMPAMIFGVTLGIINSKNVLINRLMWDFVTLFIVYIPYVLKHSKKEIKIILIVLMYLALFMYNYMFLRENQSGVMPYVFFWS